MKKRSFTLLEIMMTLTILALVAGIFTFELKGLLDLNSFQTSTKRIKEHVTRAQLLALIYDADFQITLKKEKNVWYLTTHSDEANLEKLNKKITTLKGIDVISWVKNQKTPIVLDIFSNGRIEPLGILSMKSGERVEYLDLRTPIQIIMTKKYKDSPPLIKTPPKPEKPSTL